MATRMQQRRGTASQWTTANPVLAAGEIGFESDTNQFKIGDGVNTWANLSYFVDSSSISGSLSDYVEITSLGIADGVATLDSTGNVPSSQLGNVPTVDLTGYATETFVNTAITNLIDSAPATLDTLNELAAALGDDANFATTVTTAIAGKADASHTHLLANITDVTATAAEVNILDGATVTTAELNTLDGVTATAAEINRLDGITATTTELNYTDGVTSNIQTQLNAKADLSGASFTGAISTTSSITVDGVVVSDELRNRSGQQLVLNAGESAGQASGQTGEAIYVNAEGGLEINASPDNWSSGWASRRHTVIGANGAYTNYSLPTSRTWRPITVSTSAPSGGTDGDVWMQYE